MFLVILGYYEVLNTLFIPNSAIRGNYLAKQ